jgi:hypothetical protein
MSRSRAFRRWAGAAMLASVVGIGVGGCIAVPVGGGYGEPAVGIPVPAPGVVIAPGPIIFGGHRGYYHRGYYGHGYGRGYYGHGYRRGWGG